MLQISGQLQEAGYVLVHGGAALGCAVAAMRARKIEDEGTRRGLVSFLVTTCGWALLELGFLVAPSPATMYAAYVASLVVGLATVGAWLYFCSAYTGRAFHRNRTYRRGAAVLYLVIVGVKITNPLHGLYFDAELTATPFTHLAITHDIFHWLVSGLSYALAAVGLFMLYETFLKADFDTRPLAVLAGLTGLPVVFDVVGLVTSTVLEINYEPLGVTLFAVGVLYSFEDRFFTVQLADGVDEAMIHLDAAGRVREVDRRARRLFPELADATGQRFASVFPEAADRLDSPEQILEWTQGDRTRYYLVSDISFALGQTDICRSVVLTDVTETERKRRELQRHNTQLEGFAAAIRHHLLNSLQVIDGRINHAGDALDAGDVQRANESLAKVSRVTDQMTGTINDLATLVRAGQTVEDAGPVKFGELARAAFGAAETEDLDLSVDGDGEVIADKTRLYDLFEEGFEFAAANGASTVTVALHENGFAIADDGEKPGDGDVDRFFEYGRAAPDSDTGMSLPNLRMLARTQGWEITLDTEYTNGFRFVVSGVITDRVRATTGGLTRQ